MIPPGGNYILIGSLFLESQPLVFNRESKILKAWGAFPRHSFVYVGSTYNTKLSRITLYMSIVSHVCVLRECQQNVKTPNPKTATLKEVVGSYYVLKSF